MAKCKRYLILLLSFFPPFIPYIQGRTATPAVEDSVMVKEKRVASMVGFDARPSYAFSSFRDDVLSESLSMENARNTHYATSLHLKYGFSYTRASEAGRLYPGVWQGVGVSAGLFDHRKSIGTPLSVYLFQSAPIVNFNNRLSLDYEWNFGVSMGWKPCDGHTAYSNLIVGSRMNAYINLGVGVSWKLSREVSLIGGLDLTHFSDGNTSFPNPGVNLLGVRVGIRRVFGREIKGTPFRSDSAFSHHPLSYDLTGYGAWRKRVYRGGETPVLLNGHYAVAGLDFAPMWDIKRYFRAGVSADFQWDESTDLRRHHLSGDTSDDIRFSHPPFFSQLSVGLSARAELVMPIFSVNVGIGYNFIGPEESRASYQMANLKVYFTRSLYLNIGYQLQNFQRQSNLMLGLGYTFNSNREKFSSLLGR